jgi:hypothetical protein
MKAETIELFEQLDFYWIKVSKVFIKDSKCLFACQGQMRVSSADFGINYRKFSRKWQRGLIVYKRSDI